MTLDPLNIHSLIVSANGNHLVTTNDNDNMDNTDNHLNTANDNDNHNTDNHNHLNTTATTLFNSSINLVLRMVLP